MSDLLRSIMDIRKGLWQPHDPVKAFKMNDDTYARLLRVFDVNTFIDAGISIEIDPTLNRDEVVKLPATEPATAQPAAGGEDE